MTGSVYTWTDRTDGPGWGHWTGWSCAGTVRQSAERALEGAPPGRSAHAMRRGGMRGVSLRVAPGGALERVTGGRKAS